MAAYSSSGQIGKVIVILGKTIKLKIKDKSIEIVEGRKYRFEYLNGDEPLVGTILENKDFEYDGKSFFLIWDETIQEDFQICEDEISSLQEMV